jgi:hypothetical protein
MLKYIQKVKEQDNNFRKSAEIFIFFPLRIYKALWKTINKKRIFLNKSLFVTMALFLIAYGSGI